MKKILILAALAYGAYELFGKAKTDESESGSEAEVKDGSDLLPANNSLEGKLISTDQIGWYLVQDGKRYKYSGASKTKSTAEKVIVSQLTLMSIPVGGAILPGGQIITNS